MLTLHSRKDLNWPFVLRLCQSVGTKEATWTGCFHVFLWLRCDCDAKEMSPCWMFPRHNEMWWRTFVNGLKPVMINQNMACSHTVTVKEHTQQCESEDTEQEERCLTDCLRAKNVSLAELWPACGRWFSRQKASTGQPSLNIWQCLLKLNYWLLLSTSSFKILLSCRFLDIPDRSPGPGLSVSQGLFWDTSTGV